MKNIMNILFIALATFFTTNVNAQKPKETAELKIKTSAQCEMCKNKIEKAMAYEKGIKSSNLNIKTATLTVIYKPSKTNQENILKAISKTGYDANNLEADKKAYKNLPDCCKKDGMD